MSRSLTLGFFGLLVCSFSVVGQEGSSDSSGTESSSTQARHEAVFKRFLDLIKPQANDSPWARIPWLTNLDEARKRAVAEDKPLLVWRAGGGAILGRV